MWHASVAAYVVVITMAGWRVGFDPAFTIIPGTARNVLYILRLLTGVLMLLASLDWFVDTTMVIGENYAAAIPAAQEQTV